MTARTLYGLDALGWALLHGLPTVDVEGTPRALYDARRLNPRYLDSLSIEADVGPHPWPRETIATMLEGHAFLAQNTGFGIGPCAAEAAEFLAAGTLAAEQRALYDASDAGKIERLESALAAVVACEDDVDALWMMEPCVFGVSTAQNAVSVARAALIALRIGRGMKVDENGAVLR